ncbi:Major facilitator superfamily domain general substrate transporter [Penicillium robsamsonii]|uniref:Major facilitator superfamily domain general substrate transporter n=1 Tax=Penicillium robsamsonii TaxID=1792511 RepID=UPI00254786CA|nr:Major facilitator superfamily domain general substrate transporter [Penicillium robsamsonii]KAJ5813134.1 Major facilitator superfamily domain general substrate transporter [Penicillium robsamsonii]
MEVAASIAIAIGPTISGLRNLFGYDYINWTWSKWLAPLACDLADEGQSRVPHMVESGVWPYIDACGK